MNTRKIIKVAGIASASAVALGAAACATVAPRHGGPVVSQRWRELARFRYAHRGLHGQGVPENSLTAFERARDHGYGAELDVHLTLDGRLVVIHDSEIERMCGRAGIVELLTLDELRSCRLAGTDEHIPTFEEVLCVFEAAADEEWPDPAPLIVEVKTYENNHAELMPKVMAALDAHLVRYCVESFDPRVVAWLRRNRPEVVRGQLAENFLGQDVLSPVKRVGGTYLAGNAAGRPDFVAYKFEDRDNNAVRLSCDVLRARKVYWTIRTPEDLALAEQEGAVAIFEGFMP